jgi:hypothetical protein
MKLFLITLITFLFVGTSLAQDVTIRGQVHDKANGEPMAFEKVKLLNKDSVIVTGAVTDVNGIFSIPKVNKGNYILQVENMTYYTFTVNVEVKVEKDILDYNILLEKLPKIKSFNQVNVTATAKEKKNQTQVSTLKMSKKDLERIPSMGAENDIVGGLSVTPGVVTTGDQGGQLYVRGGTPIQNKILLDGMTIYNPFHSIGFFSIFETELVKNADIYTGGFDA